MVKKRRAGAPALGARSLGWMLFRRTKKRSSVGSGGLLTYVLRFRRTAGAQRAGDRKAYRHTQRDVPSAAELTRSTAAKTCPESDMNPYAANFQVPVVPTATTGAAVVGPGLEGEVNDQGQEAAAWAAEDPSQNVDGAGGYWDEHGQHHPGYGGEYDPAVYHPDGYDPAYHQVSTR